MRIIAGLEIPDAGQVTFVGEDVTEKSAYERKAGFVFQDYALFQHMNVFENIAFGLRVLPREEAAERPRRSSKRVARVAPVDPARRLRKTVALATFRRAAAAGRPGARALAIEPRVLLLDEPFGALDAKVRKDLRKWLRHFHDQTHLTSLFVTHDQDEAFELADRVVIFNEGRIQQIGSPAELREESASTISSGSS